MTELEGRLRSTLADVADGVPASRDAWAEHERRLAVRRRARRRGSVLAAAAAVVAVVGGVVLVRDSGGPPATGSGAPTASVPRGVDPAPDDPYRATLGNPFRLGEFDDAGQHWEAWAFLQRHPEGRGWVERLCVVGVPTGQPVNGQVRHPNSAGCIPAPSWQRGIPPALVHTYAVLGGQTIDSGPLPGLLLFATAPEVRQLTARDAGGAAVAVRELGRTDSVALFLADFGGSAQGFGYTARDAAGNVVEEAIT